MINKRQVSAHAHERIDRETKVMVISTGVWVRREPSSTKEELIRGKEVILSAGTIGSAQLLLLSGIGPRAELEQHSIPVVVDLPGVGKNLEDHLATSLQYITPISTLSMLDFTPQQVQRWAMEGKGPLASSGVESLAWFQVNKNG
jgi:choline dehydrogenase-like flavoprotein